MFLPHSRSVRSGDAPAGSRAAPAGIVKVYDCVDFGGETFTIFNLPKMLWDMLTIIDTEEMNGEVVNDAIYQRNEFIKQKLNCNIEEVNANDWGTDAQELQKVVLAQEDVYDAAYMRMASLGSGITEGYYHCLSDIDELHLDESWWDQVVLRDTSLQGKNYAAQSSAHLMSWDGLWCIFFNETMLDNLGLEYPYQLVRDGKWTLDEMQKMSHAAASLNGDESFANTDSSKCIYGFTSYRDMFPKMMFGCNVQFAALNKDGEPELTCETEAFMNVCQKLTSIFSVQGDFLDAEVYDNTLPSHSENIFKSSRTLFLGYELKMAQRFRDMTDSFGILPFPKYDESQAAYRSTPVAHSAMFTIPVTNTEPEKVALLFDAMSFESDKSVLPKYFGVMVEQ